MLVYIEGHGYCKLFSVHEVPSQILDNPQAKTWNSRTRWVAALLCVYNNMYVVAYSSYLLIATAQLVIHRIARVFLAQPCITCNCSLRIILHVCQLKRAHDL